MERRPPLAPPCAAAMHLPERERLMVAAQTLRWVSPLELIFVMNIHHSERRLCQKVRESAAAAAGRRRYFII